MRRFITERNVVVVLFVLVIVTFSFAERDTKKIEHLYTGGTAEAPSSLNMPVDLKEKTVSQATLLPAAIKVNSIRQ